MESISLYERHTLLFLVSLSLSTSGKRFLSTAVRLSMDGSIISCLLESYPRLCFSHTLPCPTLALTTSGGPESTWSSSVTPSRPLVPMLFSERTQLCLTLDFCQRFSEQSGPFSFELPLERPSLGKCLITSSAHQTGCILQLWFNFFFINDNLWIYTIENLLAHSWSSAPPTQGVALSHSILPSPRTFADTQWLFV